MGSVGHNTYTWKAFMSQVDPHKTSDEADDK